jgi:hypothetical protein
VCEKLVLSNYEELHRERMIKDGTVVRIGLRSEEKKSRLKNTAHYGAS